MCEGKVGSVRGTMGPTWSSAGDVRLAAAGRRIKLQTEREV
jgi:hypothetical protein